MAKIYEGRKILSDWHRLWINAAIHEYYKLHPKPRLAKKPELEASTIRSKKVYLRNSKGDLIAIYGSTTRNFLKVTIEKIKKHSIKIKINQPRVSKVKAQSLKTN